MTVALGFFLFGGCTTRERTPPSPPATPAPAAAASPDAGPLQAAAPSDAQPAAVAVAAAPAAPAARTPKRKKAPTQPPTTKKECAKCNGLWAIHGLADVASCNCRPKDGGKTCRDGKDCKGSCLADENKFEVVEPGPPPRGFYTGKCSEFAIAFGCFKFIPEGIRAKGPQLKEDAAEDMCVD